MRCGFILHYVVANAALVFADQTGFSSENQIKPFPLGCQLPETFPRGSFSLDGEIIKKDNEYDYSDYENDGKENEQSLAPLGSEIKFQCQPEYGLIGPSRVVCLRNGQWESSLPRCRKQSCNRPPPIEGGIWRRTRRGLYNLARLQCIDGYVPENPKVMSVRCLEVNQTELDWAGEWPACRKLAVCPDPGRPAVGTGKRIGPATSEFYEGMKVSIQCSEEFELIGQETIVCQNDSTWDFPRARCKPNVTCEDIPEDPHRILTVSPSPQTADFFVPGDMLDLNCMDGFGPDKLQGSTLIVCENHGFWDDDLAMCKETVCLTPELPKNGFLINENENGKYKPNSEVRYRCQPGYRLFGYNWNRCTDMGWKNKAPRCEEVTCRDPGPPEHGKRHGDSIAYRVNSTVDFSCFDGYKLIGSSKRKCMSNGQWDGKLAVCTPRGADGCPNPGIPINGLRSGAKSSNFQPGDVVSFRCNPTFTMEGSLNRTCLENGQWDGEETKCRGRYDVDRPEDVKFRLLNELDTDLTLQDTQLNGAPVSAVSGRMLDMSIRNTGGHLVFYFVFDSSDSVGSDNFQTSIKFATALIRRVGVSNNVHVSLVTYGSTAQIVLSPLRNTMEIVMRKLSNITYLGGGTATKAAIKMVRSMVTQTSRTLTGSIQSVVFLVTDGLHNVGGNPEEEAKTLKDMGVEIFVIGLVGHKNINRNSMIHIASSGGKHVYFTDGYETMEYLVDELLTDSVDYSHCGISVRNVSDNMIMKGKVYGGQFTVIHWPWMAHLNIKQINEKGQLSNGTCGGSVVDNSWILTAAHCFNGTHPDNITVTVGVLNLKEDNDGDRQTRAVERIWIHPNFNRTILDYDLALLKLKTPLRYGKYIRRICLPPDVAEIEKKSLLYHDNASAIAIGFGQTEDNTMSNELKEVDLHIQNRGTCLKSIEDYKDEAVMTEQMICAGHPEGEKDTCEGDSGGPLMQEVHSGSKVREPYWVQVGIVSWGVRDKCGVKGFYGFYTHLAKLKNSVMEEIETH